MEFAVFLAYMCSFWEVNVWWALGKGVCISPFYLLNNYIDVFYHFALVRQFNSIVDWKSLKSTNYCCVSFYFSLKPCSFYFIYQGQVFGAFIFITVISSDIFIITKCSYLISFLMPFLNSVGSDIKIMIHALFCLLLTGIWPFQAFWWTLLGLHFGISTELDFLDQSIILVFFYVSLAHPTLSF